MSDGARTLPGTAEEGVRLAGAARGAGLALALLGGVAVWARCPSARVPPLARPYGDADLAGRSRDRREITAFMEAEGYEADRMFNALHGASRLNFQDPVRDRPLDVLLDRFTMCHALDLRDRLDDPALTLPLGDLLLTKLQVVTLNEKDLRDILALLADHEVDTERVLAITHADWGFEHTIHRTLATVRERAGEFGLPADAVARIVARADALGAALEAAPKSARWRMRARVGERARWYEEPEEARG